MDEISQEPRHEFRLPPGPPRWLTATMIAGLIAAFAVFGITRLGGQHSDRVASVPTATAAPNPGPVVSASVLPFVTTVPGPLIFLPGPTPTSLAPVNAPIPASAAPRHHSTRHG